ncbi:recombinase family protein [Pectobacterium polaris]|uniref:recombinase family protein n=1 Tax=Pectobacterium polaris TaxID=2042057 RepID=UPI000EA243E0|nr:recombinase family protein [Pectobacterium polaris]RJL20332.1 recombinase family protein [Pectobacterium polaris]
MPQDSNGIAYSYVRFSSKKQASGDSLRRQTEMAEEYASRHMLRLSSKNFQDLGISAFREGKRPSLADMLTAIDEGQITAGSTIIIEALDRLSRRGIDVTLETVKEILRKDVQIVSLSDGLVLTKSSLNELQSVIRIALAADLAYKESERKAQRLRETKGQQRQDALNGIPINKILPFWLKRTETGYTFSDKVETARQIVTLKQEGKGSNMIAKFLNKRGIAGIRTAQWNHASITKMLKNPALYGAYQTGETNKEREMIQLEIVEGYYPALISKDEWLLLQSDQSKSTRGRRSTDNPYSGLLRCGCGGALIKRKSTIRGKLYVYHGCLNAKDGRCSQNLSIKGLDDALATMLGRLEFKKAVTSDRSAYLERQQLENRIANLNKTLQEVDHVPASVIQTIITMEARIKEITQQIETGEREQRGIDAVNNAKLSSITDSLELNLMLKRVLKSITVTRCGLGWAVRVFHLSGHSQSFLLVNGQLKLVSDSIALKRLLAEYMEDDKTSSYEPIYD